MTSNLDIESLLEDLDEIVGKNDQFQPYPPSENRQMNQNNPKTKFAINPSSKSPIERSGEIKPSFESPNSLSKQNNPITNKSPTKSPAKSPLKSPVKSPTGYVNNKDSLGSEDISETLDNLLSLLPNDTATTSSTTPFKPILTPTANNPFAPKSFNPEDALKSSQSLFSSFGLATSLSTEILDTNETTSPSRTRPFIGSSVSNSFDSGVNTEDSNLLNNISNDIFKNVNLSNTSSTSRCTKVFLGGGDAVRGLKASSFSKCVCNNMRCTNCNFLVLCYLNAKWDATADYMFFRNNVPSDSKLSVKLNKVPGSAAYCCQCAWVDANQETSLSQGQPQWICIGH